MDVCTTKDMQLSYPISSKSFGRDLEMPTHRSPGATAEVAITVRQVITWVIKPYPDVLRSHPTYRMCPQEC